LLVLIFKGGERSGSVCSLGSVRSSSSLQGSGNTHVLTTPAPSPHPASTPGLNTHGLNAPGLHAQAEGVKLLATVLSQSVKAKEHLLEQSQSVEHYSIPPAVLEESHRPLCALLEFSRLFRGFPTRRAAGSPPHHISDHCPRFLVLRGSEQPRMQFFLVPLVTSAPL
ncbi:hypothetical protein GOODEAATRI_003035, partial [Goodea atripinnis]